MLTRKSFLNSNALFYTITTALYVLLLLLIARNLFVPELWFDEAGQIFIAHGLNHFSEPLSPDGSFYDAMTANHDYNQDPGGYTAILYAWSKISSGHIWLRILSFIFFLGAIVFTCLISFEVLRDKKLAYASGLMVFALICGTFAHEVRAYAMELCGTTYGIWMVLKLRKPTTRTKLLSMSLILCLFITSRYTMLVIGGILSCFVLYNLYSIYGANNNRRELVVRTIVYSLPLLIMVILIWKYQMSYQNPGAKPLAYIQYIPGKKWLMPFAFASLILVGTMKWHNEKSRFLLALFLAINICFLILGFFKVLPWDIMDNKGGVFLLTLNITMYNCFVSLLRKNAKLSRYVPFIVLVGWSVYMLGINRLSSIANIHGRESIRISQIESALSANSYPIYVSAWCSPEVRYLYEFGDLKERAETDGYPEKFHFLKNNNHHVGIKKINIRKINADILENTPVGTILYSTNTVMDSVPPSFYELKKGLFIKR